ncbi:MAG: VCBS repeat-containing protein [Acidobacteriota bacterium]
MKRYAFIISIAVALDAFAFGSTGRCAPLYANRAQAATTPKVSAEFQAEVSQLTSTGSRLKEAVEASLDGTAHHLAAIFQQEKPKAPNEAFELRILEGDGRTSKTIFRRSDFFFSFALAREPNRLNATDINGDGIKEIIVQSSSGGNCWSCNPTEIYQVRNHKAELIAAAPIQRIADLNGDGIHELLVTDARWESYDDLSHAASPGAVMVYGWRNGKYVYAARDFADFYTGELDRIRASIEEAKSQITAGEYSDEAYVGLAIGLALTYAHTGDVERGLKEMEALLNSNAKSAAQAKHRLVIIDDFRKGDSAKKLREMKYGDPLPL